MARTPADRSLFVDGIAQDLPVTASATTSRSLVDNDQVRVVMFAFDVGEELTEHTAALPVVVQVVTGALRFEVAGETRELSAGDVVYLAANEPHSLQALEPCLMSLVMIRGGD